MAILEKKLFLYFGCHLAINPPLKYNVFENIMENGAFAPFSLFSKIEVF